MTGDRGVVWSSVCDEKGRGKALPWEGRLVDEALDAGVQRRCPEIRECGFFEAGLYAARRGRGWRSGLVECGLQLIKLRGGGEAGSWEGVYTAGSRVCRQRLWGRVWALVRSVGIFG